MNSSLKSLLNGFDDSLWLRGRVRVAAQGAQSTNGDFVLYWMHNAVRAHENPALDVALLAAEELGTSVLVYHAISEQYPFASDRLHAFMLEGARDVQREFAQRGIPYVFHLEREGHRGPHLRTLAERAALVVTEDVPVEPIRGWVDRLTETTTTPVWAVDSSCVVPMQLVGKAYTRAFAFRNATAAMYDERMGFEPSEITDPSDWGVPNDLPFEPLDLATLDSADLIGDCRIDHAVGPVPHTCGGSVAGYDRWNAFKASGLRAYAKNRNNALLDGVSRMSAYLHFGMVSSFRLAREAMQVGGNGAEKYLVAQWNGRIVEIDDGRTRKRDSSDRFVGVPGMNAVCQNIARDVTVHRGVTIHSMRRDERWQLFAADQEIGEFDHVVLAMPPVQAAELLNGISTLSDRISQIPLAPCWAVMLAFAKPIASPVDGAFVKNASISWIARNSSKPDRPSAEDCWVLHGNADWSAAHLECSGEQIVEQLLPEFFSVLDVDAQQPLHEVTHRWRYANPAEPLTSGFLRDAGKNVVVCGDWCLGNRVEAAFLSGISAAGAIMRHALISMTVH